MNKKPNRNRYWYTLLLLPYLVLLWPAFYVRADPTLFGVPFFYWYQFAWVPASALITGVVYLTTVERRSENDAL